jgi:hypothetical protein
MGEITQMAHLPLWEFCPTWETPLFSSTQSTNPLHSPWSVWELCSFCEGA